MKKLLSVLLVLCLCAGVLVGCGGRKKSLAVEEGYSFKITPEEFVNLYNEISDDKLDYSQFKKISNDKGAIVELEFVKEDIEYNLVYRKKNGFMAYISVSADNSKSATKNFEAECNKLVQIVLGEDNSELTKIYTGSEDDSKIIDKIQFNAHVSDFKMFSIYPAEF